LGDLVLDPPALLQAAVTGGLDLGAVDEEIGAAVLIE
jgi:hypothetical protein